MKKLAILLGTLAIAASAFAGGKEVVPAPAGPTVIKEVERVVYRDRGSNGGYVELLYKWWGLSSAHDDKYIITKDGVHYVNVKDRLKSNSGRLQLQGLVNITDKQSIYFRVRDEQAWNQSSTYKYHDGSDTKEVKYPVRGSTKVRLEYTYKHDESLLGGFNSVLRYQHAGGDDAAYGGRSSLTGNVGEYLAVFDLKKYIFDTDIVSKFTIAPKVGHVWSEAGGGTWATYEWNNTTKSYDTKNHAGRANDSYVGINVTTSYKLPLNFTIDANLYVTQHFYNKDFDIAKIDTRYPNNTSHSSYDDELTVALELYLKNRTKLVEWDKTTLYFDFDGGFDNYAWSNRDRFKARTNYYNYTPATATSAAKYSRNNPTDSDYLLYAQPQLLLDHKATENVNVFVRGGIYIQNVHTAGSEAQGWEWQPTADAGFKVTF
jgi:hypothetical protein